MDDDPVIAEVTIRLTLEGATHVECTEGLTPTVFEFLGMLEMAKRAEFDEGYEDYE